MGLIEGLCGIPSDSYCLVWGSKVMVAGYNTEVALFTVSVDTSSKYFIIACPHQYLTSMAYSPIYILQQLLPLKEVLWYVC